MKSEHDGSTHDLYLIQVAACFLTLANKISSINKQGYGFFGYNILQGFLDHSIFFRDISVFFPNKKFRGEREQ